MTTCELESLDFENEVRLTFIAPQGSAWSAGQYEIVPVGAPRTITWEELDRVGMAIRIADKEYDENGLETTMTRRHILQARRALATLGITVEGV